MPGLARKVLRLTFTIAGTVAPKRAGKLAFRVFSLAPPRDPKGERARSVFAAGAARLARAETFALTTPHGKVMSYCMVPSPEAAVAGAGRFLIVHGWGSRSEYMAALGEGIVKATGGEVVLIDFPGHGASSGRSLDMRLALEAITSADQHFGPFAGAVGHSFGGASLMVAARQMLPGFPKFSPGRMALIGAPSEMGGVLRFRAQQLGLTDMTRAYLEREVRRVTGRRAKDFDIAVDGAELEMPVLVVHAEDDKEVSADHARRYAAHGPQVKLGWANGYGHRRIIAAPPTISLVSAFMAGNDDPQVPETD